MRIFAVIKHEKLTITLVALIVLASLDSHAESRDDYWPTWRGPNSDGVAVKGDPPITWSETENIKWKIELPDNSDCTPIIWGDRIFIQTAIPLEDGADAHDPKPKDFERERFFQKPKHPFQFNVVCLDRNTGATLWTKTVREEYAHEGFHPDGSMASYSPVTDGKLVWVNFGTRGVHCFDVDGNNVWSTDLIPHFTIRSFGEGSSPALVEDSIIVVADHEGQSKIFAFDKDTGDVRWEKARDETTSWATPMPVMVDGRYQVVVNGTKQIRSYDLETGDIVWECSGLTILAIPSPVISDGKVFCTTGYQGQVMMALNLDGKGDITESDSVVWKIEEGTPYISSPLLYNGRIYMFDSLKANLSCYEASTGKPIYVKEKLEGLKQVYASPIGAAGRIYASDRKGTTIVLKESDSIEVLATNTLEDKFDASPVVVGDELYLKGAKYLYCIAKS